MSARTTDLVSAIETMGAETKAAMERAEEQLRAVKSENQDLRGRLEELEARASTPGKIGNGNATHPDGPEIWVDRKTGDKVPVLSHKHRLSDLQPNKTGVTVGRWLRGVLTGRHADDGKELEAEIKALATSPDASGGYTVPAPLAREFIDLLRARMVLSRAGARTVPMTSKTLSIAKITGDATVGWHAENAAITPSDPTFDAVTLDAKTIVGLVKLSLELSQDSLNIEDAIVRSLTGATGVAIDAAGLGNTVANGPSGILSFSGRNQVSGIGALANYDDFVDAMGLLLNADVALESIGPIVLGTQAWTDLAKLKTGISSDNTPLVKPAALMNLAMLPTTAAQSGSPLTSTAYMADWSDLLFGVRQDVTVRVLNEIFLGSNLQVAVLVYARVDFQAAREASFVTLEDITHS